MPVYSRRFGKYPGGRRRVFVEVHTQTHTTSACLGNTPITFPIDWHNSKIPGFCDSSQRAGFPRIYGAGGDVPALQRAIFPPQVGGPGSYGWTEWDRCSASITTKSSTRRRTCSIQPWKTRTVGGLQLGVMTAGWWPERCRTSARHCLFDGDQQAAIGLFSLRGS